MNSRLQAQNPEPTREWLEADGLGGFASGTSSGIRSRRYHALLLTATTPPTGRAVLINGFDAWVETANGTFSLSSQRYSPDVIGGDGAQRIEGFGWEPWPHWIFKLEDGTRIEHELFVPKGEPMTCLSWRVLGPGKSDVKLFVRPFLSGRDYHALHKTNAVFRFEADVTANRVCWQPYAGVPAIAALPNGNYSHQPHWYYNFLYEAERARGLDCEEDLAAPGVFEWNLADRKAALVLTTKQHAAATLSAGVNPLELLNQRRDREQKRRDKFPSRLHAAADAYIVERHTLPPHPPFGHPLPHWGRGQGEGEGPQVMSPAKTIIAGHPWFTDWGRDTFIALRGICLATGRLDVARDILLAWASAVSEGMLPNRFPDHGEQLEFNAVDASLWYVIAVHEYLEASKSVISRSVISEPARARSQRSTESLITDSLITSRLVAAVEAILDGYTKGTRYGIRADSDGLLASGVPGVQLTWMDAKVGDWVVTPRIGKPVEVQALWLNALRIASQFSPRWQAAFEHGLASFRDRFWNEAGCYLNDVVDCNHQSGVVDATFRPNQILAVGGLPFSLLEDEHALRVVAAVEARLWAPLGLRSLAPGEPGYTPHYVGGVRERDGAYHQGTVWPWLIGPFVEAWVRVRGNTNEAKREARGKFLTPILAHLEEAGLGHISEIADAEAPHMPRGCPFQAWSVGEALRLDRVVLAETTAPRARQSGRRRSPRELVPA
jgi:glycogen debranching enzyme